MKTSLLGIFILLLTGCASGPPASSNNAARDTVDPRAALYKRKCIACHTPIDPTEHSDKEWQEIMTKHQDRLKLSDDDRSRYGTVFNEKEYLEAAQGFLAKEFNCAVEIVQADNPQRYDPGNKARFALPLRPALFLE